MTAAPNIDWSRQMEHIELKQVSTDGLTETEWCFLLARKGFVVDYYRVSTRSSKRHKFTIVVEYVRLKHCRQSDRTLNLISEREVPLTPFVKARLRETLSQRVFNIPIQLPDPSGAL